MSRRKVAELDTPFSSVEWPVISQDDQDAILELLCTLLAPLGRHRRDHVEPSQGKRSQRRSQRSRRSEEGRDENGGEAATKNVAIEKDGQAHQGPKQPKSNVLPLPPPPPPPELARFVDVGLSNITRELAKSAVPIMADPPVVADTGPDSLLPRSSSLTPSSASSSSSSTPYTAVFIVRSGHPSAFYSHFPQMVAVASQAATISSSASSSSSSSPSSPIRLVGFSRACEERLSASLGIPRVSSIALRAGAPQSQGLLAFLQDTVLPVDVRWLDEAQAGRYRETQIHMADVRVGPKRKKKA